MGKKQKIKLKYDNINNSPKSKITFGVCACACVCVCVFGGGGGNPKIGSKVRSSMSEEQTSEGTDSEPSEKYEQLITSLGKLQCLRTLRILLYSWEGRGPILKTIEHKPRKRRKTCQRAKK